MVNVNKTKESIQNVLIFITDAIALIMSYYMSGFIWLMEIRNNTFSYVMKVLNGNIVTIIIAVLIAALFCNIKGDVLNRGKFEELASVMKKSLISSAVIAVYELLSKTAQGVPRSVYVITFFMGTVLMFLLRMLVKVYMKHRNGGKRANSILVVTIKDRAKDTLTKAVARNDWMRRIDGIVITDEDMTGQSIEGFPVVANVHSMMRYIKNEIVDEVFIDVDYKTDEDMTGQSIEGFPVVANVHSMMRYIKNEIVDEVFIDVDYKTRESIKPMVMELEDMGVTVNLKLEILDSYKDFDSKLGYIGAVPVITFANRIYDWKGMLVKRCIDILGAIVGLIVMFIAMIFVGPAIMIESPGPIFFKQKRVGKNGRYFEIYKFRSMYMDAEERKKDLMAQNEMSGLMFKMKDDPRITKVGKFIRKTSIDELPQFINVLKGDMSLVGTRPPTVAEFKQYQGHHKRRLSMKPGITGMWQAYGRKTVSDFEEIVKMDLDYIDNWSIMLDIKILFKTVQSVLTTGGQ